MAGAKEYELHPFGVPLLGAPQRLYRVTYASDPAELPDWKYISQRNRWDDPKREYRALYLASSPLGALIETMQDLRPSVSAIARLAALEQNEGRFDTKDVAAYGVVPERFFAKRFIGHVTIAPDTAGFLAASHVISIQRWRVVLARLADQLGLSDISLATVVGSLPAQQGGGPRAFTQALSRLIYELKPPVPGIVAPSSLGTPYANYTVFEHAAGKLRADVINRAARPLDPRDPVVQEAMNVLRLRLVSSPAIAGENTRTVRTRRRFG